VPNIGPAELIVIFVVALLVFGPNKLPEIGRQVGKAIREFRRVQSSLTDDFKDAFSEEPPRPPAPATPSALPSPAEASSTAPTEPAAEEPPASEGATPGTEPR
jgi:sec-independent protein translocase protein TatA